MALIRSKTKLTCAVKTSAPDIGKGAKGANCSNISRELPQKGSNSDFVCLVKYFRLLY